MTTAATWPRTELRQTAASDQEHDQEQSDLVRRFYSPLRSLAAGRHALRQFILDQGWRTHI